MSRPKNHCPVEKMSRRNNVSSKKCPVEKVSVEKVSVEKVSVEKMSVEKMSVEKMSRCLLKGLEQMTLQSRG